MSELFDAIKHLALFVVLAGASFGAALGVIYVARNLAWKGIYLDDIDLACIALTIAAFMLIDEMMERLV